MEPVRFAPRLRQKNDHFAGENLAVLQDEFDLAAVAVAVVVDVDAELASRWYWTRLQDLARGNHRLQRRSQAWARSRTEARPFRNLNGHRPLIFFLTDLGRFMLEVLFLIHF